MEQQTKEIISAAYTVYTLLKPDGRVVMSIDSFADAFQSNLASLEGFSQPSREAPSDERANISEEEAEGALQKGLQDAEETIKDKGKLASLLKKLKQKMKSIPLAGSVFANVPTMFRLVNSYLKDEYTDIPQTKLLLIVSALSYLVAPIDLIPDFIPVIGLLDDMAVIAACTKATRKELEKYLRWREENGLDTSDEIDA